MFSHVLATYLSKILTQSSKSIKRRAMVFCPTVSVTGKAKKGLLVSSTKLTGIAEKACFVLLMMLTPADNAVPSLAAWSYSWWMAVFKVTVGLLMLACNSQGDFFISTNVGQLTNQDLAKLQLIQAAWLIHEIWLLNTPCTVQKIGISCSNINEVKEESFPPFASFAQNTVCGHKLVKYTTPPLCWL